MDAKQISRIKTSILFCLLVAAAPLTSQPQKIPLKDFAISFSTDRLELTRGDSSQVEVTILKSKGFQKSKVTMGKSSSLPKGVTLTFAPASGTFNVTKALIAIQDDALPGEYLVVLNATLSYKTKGSILNLLIK